MEKNCSISLTEIEILLLNKLRSTYLTKIASIDFGCRCINRQQACERFSFERITYDQHRAGDNLCQALANSGFRLLPR